MLMFIITIMTVRVLIFAWQEEQQEVKCQEVKYCNGGSGSQRTNLEVLK